MRRTRHTVYERKRLRSDLCTFIDCSCIALRDTVYEQEAFQRHMEQLYKCGSVGYSRFTCVTGFFKRNMFVCSPDLLQGYHLYSPQGISCRICYSQSFQSSFRYDLPADDLCPGVPYKGII